MAKASKDYQASQTPSNLSPTQLTRLQMRMLYVPTCFVSFFDFLTNKPSQSWIGYWWEGWSFAFIAWCLASDMYRLTQSHSDSYTSDSVTYTPSDSFSLIQISIQLICSDSFISLTQIHPASLRSALTHSDSCNLTQICSASCRFTQIRSDSHSDSPDLIQTCSDPSRLTRIHSDSHSFTPASCCLPQTHPD